MTENLSVIAHQCREAMARGWRVDLLLKTGAAVVGRIESMPENRLTRDECRRAAPNTRSQLQVMIDGRPTSIEQIREVRPAL